MTWSYISTDLSGSREQIRTHIGDTDTTDQLLSDEQIALAETTEGTVGASAALCADWISAKYARKADKSAGDLSISYSQIAKQYADLAKRLRANSSGTLLPYFGGISITAKETREEDTDRVKPAFTVDMLDDPSITSSDETAEDE